jgi:chaperonin GroEL
LIAEDVEGDALSTMVVNKLEARVKCAAVKAPGFGDERKELLEDVAVLTGAYVVSEEKGLSLDKATVRQFGRCRRAVIGKEKTILVGGDGIDRAIKARIASLRKQIKAADSDYDREKLEERVAKLTGGVAVIKVGAATEAEMKSRKYKVEEAVHATKAGLEEGVLPGGGVALLRAQSSVEKLKSDNADEKTGIRIVHRALEEPVRVIAENAGAEGSLVAEKIRASSKANFGYNAETGQYGDMIQMGIVDPLKVTRLALQNAASLAGTALTADVLVAERPGKQEPPEGVSEPSSPPPLPPADEDADLGDADAPMDEDESPDIE